MEASTGRSFFLALIRSLRFYYEKWGCVLLTKRAELLTHRAAPARSEPARRTQTAVQAAGKQSEPAGRLQKAGGDPDRFYGF